MVALHHFTLPRWVANRGGVISPDFPQYFNDFTKKVYEHLGDLVSLWITFNEPITIGIQGYMTGVWPPQTGEPNSTRGLYFLSFAAMRNTLLAHVQAYETLHRLAEESQRKVQVGMAHYVTKFQPAVEFNKNYLFNMAGSFILNRAHWIIPKALETGTLSVIMAFRPAFNDFIREEYLPEVKGRLDFFGVNYYRRERVKVDLGASNPEDQFGLLATPGHETSVMGWEIYPQGLTEVLLKIEKHFPSLPIYIMENGLADPTDLLRGDFIKDHLAAMHKAMELGVNVKGYCYWTFIDNFEWAYGYDPKMGLFALDPETLERIPRPSAYLYKDIIENNGFYHTP